MCVSGHDVALIPGVLRADSESSSDLHYCERTAKMCLLGHGGEGVLLHVSSAPHGHACIRKIHGYAHTGFSWVRKKYGGSLCMAVEKNAVQHPVKT